jgi:putative hydrolase of the HAD superfamily
MTMAVKGVLFDLFGTLIPAFRRREHMVALRACAEVLGIDAEACQSGWVTSFPDRVRGTFATVADNFGWIVQRAGGTADAGPLARAEQRYLQFTVESLGQVDPDTVAALHGLTNRGLFLGLVTNCAPDVPQAWAGSPLAPYFSYCAFSCTVGAVKPQPEIYRAALDGLGLDPASAVFVGDGSDEELSGATACGMRAVLVRRDLSNTYDAARGDVAGWTGPSVTRIGELADLL